MTTMETTALIVGLSVVSLAVAHQVRAIVMDWVEYFRERDDDQ